MSSSSFKGTVVAIFERNDVVFFSFSSLLSFIAMERIYLVRNEKKSERVKILTLVGCEIKMELLLSLRTLSKACNAPLFPRVNGDIFIYLFQPYGKLGEI